MDATHDYHQGLPNYIPDAVFQDGCATCEARADGGLDDLLYLDDQNMGRLWERMLVTKFSQNERVDVSGAELRCMSRTLYPLVCLLQQHGWMLDRLP